MERTFGADATALVTEVLADARQRTLCLIEDIEDIEDSGLERMHSTLMSPLAWGMVRIVAFEDLWLAHRLGGMP